MLRTIPPLALLLALADPAHAQFPNTSRLIGFDSLLTLEQCQEPGFLDGASSGQRAFCADLFEDEIDRLAGTAQSTPTTGITREVVWVHHDHFVCGVGPTRGPFADERRDGSPSTNR